MKNSYDLIVVGTGFASSFFLKTWLERMPPRRRVLVLERGRVDSHNWQVRQGRTSSIEETETFVNRNPRKEWTFSLGFGGGSNCWWACTPRMLPNDFRLHSAYGIGEDWPMTYDELEPFYSEAEAVMSVSGPADAPFPRSRPYPQPPHRFSDPDRLLKTAYPDKFFQQPTARARIATAKRPACCASGVCEICPINAKFTIANDLGDLYRDPRITLALGADVRQVEVEAGVARAVVYQKGGAMKRARGDLIVLGANAIFNPYLLQRSGFDGPELGRGLNEQVAIYVQVDLAGVDNFQGSTSITGHGYMLYDGPHRARRPAVLVESYNIPDLRIERGKWRQRLVLKCVFEDLRRPDNYVGIDADGGRPEVIYLGPSLHTQRGIDALPDIIAPLMQALPTEKFSVSERSTTEGHILGTTVMGDNPGHSVIDRYCRHHKVRNLVVLGGGAFPTSAPANPTLTVAALSLWSAHHLLK